MLAPPGVRDGTEGARAEADERPPSLVRRLVLASLDKMIRNTLRSGALYPRTVSGEF